MITIKMHTHFKISSLLLLVISLYSFFGHSQQDINKGGYWVTYLGDNKINEHFGIHSEAQIRSLGVNNTFSQKFFRTGINYYTTKTSMLTAGYGFFYTEPTRDMEGAITREHRIWEQLILRNKNRYAFTEHRFRLEQRIINTDISPESLIDHRMRYRFQAIMPFYNLSPYLRYFFLATYNEVMLNFRSASSEVFDRNRLYFALGVQIRPNLNIQFGYLNQLAQQKKYSNHEVNHLLQLGLSYNMDDLMKTFYTSSGK